MKRRPSRKRFTGLVHYGKARHAMYSGWATTVRRMEKKGWMSPLESIEQRGNMQRTFTRKRQKV